MECPGRSRITRLQGNANPLPASPAFPVFTPYTSATRTTLTALAMGWRPPTIYHYSLGLQSRLPGGAVLDVAYAGARDLHTILGRSMNQAALASASTPIRGQTTNTVANINSRKPYLGWTSNSMYYFNTDGEAWYSALQASLTQKFKHSFQYQAAYTWQRLLSPVRALPLGRTNSDHPAIRPRCTVTALDMDRIGMSGRSGLYCPRTMLSPARRNLIVCWQPRSVGGVLQPLLWFSPASRGALPTTTSTALTAFPAIGRAMLLVAPRRMQRLRDRSVIEWTTTSTKRASGPGSDR